MPQVVSAADSAPRKVKSSAKAEPKAASSRSSKRKVSRQASSAKSGNVKKTSAARSAPARMSVGQMIGLHDVQDPLSLRSSVALVIDQNSGATVFEKNAQAVLPIASITKLMTAMVVLDAQLPLDEVLQITKEEIDTEKHTSSRLAIGSKLTRDEMLHLALMASENRAAHALGRHYPGGIESFIAAMNAKARSLGMNSTSFSDPTGLSSRNVSNAVDLARMVHAAHDYPLIRMYSTAPDLTVRASRRAVGYHNTNRLLANPAWDISLQKTGYISEAGSCLVMHMQVDGRPMVLVLLDARGVLSRFGDAKRLRDWLEGPGRITPLRTTDASYSPLGS
jgi:D-alanyl-D-alanine endopeptidase (penicillin-binding protein 7)